MLPPMPATPAHAPDTLSAEKPPFRRKLFYVPGYDPFPPRRYRELYRAQGAAQAAIGGYRLTIAPDRPEGGYGWRVRADIAGPALCDVEVLVWNDLVERSMNQAIAATYAQLLRTAWVYLGSGALWRLVRLRKGPTIAALYPVAVLAMQAALALGLGWAAGAGLARLVPLAGWAAAPAVAWAVLWAFRRADRHVFAWYLMHDYAFAAQAGGAYPPALERRIGEFAARIRAALGQGYDEVLVVGHSSGAHIGVSALADLIRAGLAPGAPPLGLLSLGHVVPMVSFLPAARRLRADLRYLSARDEITWVDVTAPGDGCAFALCDPVAVTGVAPPGRKWPLVLSAAFSQTLRPETWARLRWRFFRLHFQYLCAFDRPGDYDYFQITAGPRTLAARYAGRVPSKNRITRAISGYTDT